MLPSRKLLFRPKLLSQLAFAAAYSRKSDSKNQGCYKMVKSNDVIDDVIDSRFGPIPNWELLAPKGYRFLLPGCLGPAWHEAGSMVPIDTFHRSSSKVTKVDLTALECTAQQCPVLLRKGVLELFPNNEMYTSQQLTVVTITHKKNLPRINSTDFEPEYDAKTFVWAAQEICMKLKSTGYWADFINPFSGRPYLSPYYKSTLYETDERFRCLGFEIKKSGNCKVIQSRDDKQFIGLVRAGGLLSTWPKFSVQDLRGLLDLTKTRLDGFRTGPWRIIEQQSVRRRLLAKYLWNHPREEAIII